MATDDIFGTFTSSIDLGGAMDTTTTVVIYILLAAVVGAILWFIFYLLSFKFKARIRTIINGRTVISEDKARRFKDKGGVYWWKFLKSKDKIPEPPSECIDINVKGKKIVEFFKADDGSYIPIQVDFDYARFKQGEMAKKDATAFKPFPTNQRGMLVQEYREAESYKKKKLGETLMALAPYIAIVLILVIFMIFFNDAVKPSTELGLKVVESQKIVEQACGGVIDACTACMGQYRTNFQPINQGNVTKIPN